MIEPELYKNVLFINVRKLEFLKNYLHGHKGYFEIRMFRITKLCNWLPQPVLNPPNAFAFWLNVTCFERTNFYFLLITN